MEAAYSSETSVDFQRTARRYIPEDRTLNQSIYLHRTESVLIFIGAEAFKKLASFMETNISLPSGNDKPFNVNKKVKVKVKISLLQAVEAPRVARG
jgi:hypothetical protein